MRRSKPTRDEFDSAWERYFVNHQVLASWGHQNGRMPTCRCDKCKPEPTEESRHE